jgi:hypothetical protein
MQVVKGDLTIPIRIEKYQLNRICWRVCEISENDTKQKFCSLDKHAALTVIFRPMHVSRFEIISGPRVMM